MNDQFVDATTVLATLMAYEKLAKDAANRAVIMKDKSCIQFLAYILEDQDTKIILTALQVLKLLSERPDHAFTLSKVFGVIPALQFLLNTNIDDLVQITAQEVLGRLQNAASKVRTTVTVPLRDTQTNSRERVVEMDDQTEQKMGRTHSIFRPGIGATKTVVLQIHGLATKMDRKLCEEALVKVNGVISFTFNMKKKFCILKTKAKVAPETLISAIAETRMTASQPNPSYQESFPMGGSTSRQCNKENAGNLPTYLPEDDDDIDTTYGGGSVTSTGVLKQTTHSWFNSAANFVSKSFYW